MGDQYCIIASNRVTGICIAQMVGADKKCTTMAEATITPVSANHTSISGTLSTTNVIMATWSRMMWQGVVDRTLRMLASGPFRLHFIAATAIVGGN
ncbi:hypothetical protein KIN20_010157 [Parelaphostrongylus tenuis]|uniref:Uncharacterized protein n=1 Tax=Parelaphostrongylus tenuis TaxID=148309 RepID=A0AAD5QLP4_PARTN|nr:hypothetical protein KIN20_010157 [Parelaphostrongylus tenuis]